MGIWSHFDTLAAPDTPGKTLAQFSDVNPALQNIPAGAHILGKVAHVAPIPFGDASVHGIAFFQQNRKEVFAEIKADGQLEIVQDIGFKHIDAGIHRIGDDLTPARFLQELLDAPLVIDDDHPVLQRVGDTI